MTVGIDDIDNQTCQAHVDLLEAAEAIEIIGQKLEPDRIHQPINLDMANGDLVGNAKETLNYIEESIKTLRDDYGDEYQYDEQTRERLFKTEYDNTIGNCKYLFLNSKY